MFAQGTDLLAGCIRVPPHMDTYLWVGARMASRTPASIFGFGCCPVTRELLSRRSTAALAAGCGTVRCQTQAGFSPTALPRPAALREERAARVRA